VTLLPRAARPADADAVVPLMHESSRALIDAIFGSAAGTVLHRDFVRGKGLFGYRQQIVGVRPDGEIAATMTAYEGRRYQRLTLHTLGAAARLGPVRLARVIRRTMAVSALFTPPAADGLFLANLCVAPAHRDHGYGSTLIGYAVRSAPALGLATVELDVSLRNVPAQRLYERLGFVVTGEIAARDGSGLDGFRRMTRDAARTFEGRRT
jgi:ribosomal protein S18 acetylase RimI-like enzyme